MLLFLAAAVSAVFFAVINTVGDRAIYSFVTNTDYMDRKNVKTVQELQNYITENRVSAGDSEALTEWVKKHPAVMIQIYRNNYIVYDSQYPDADLEKEKYDRYGWVPVYTLSFADGDAEAVLYGFYDYQFSNYALIAEIILAFLLFLGIVMLGIRKTIRYILRLSEEIKVLESGGLDCPITVQGKDELAQLAEGLDSMRQSFLRQTEQERQLTLANQRMITEMSHDLRTPLTSIMLYTEILLKNKYRDEEQRVSYIRKIDRKARLLKQLSDHLFEYALVSGETDVPLEGPFAFKAVFYDLLSDTTTYLEHQGFRVDIEFTWEERYIRVNSDYISRIFDNLASNIVKYADPNLPVRIGSVYSGLDVGVSVRNKKAASEERTESTRIGLKNIQSMMEKMNGKASIEQTEEDFTIILRFPDYSAD